MSYHEATRLRTLYSYAVLDTPPEPNFDRITRLTAGIFKLPVCTLSLADADRHWFKSHFGVDATEMPRSMSFCDETLRRPEGFVVRDAAADPRFAKAPVVAGPPGFRFYAGAPLVTPDGHPIGSLCVLDTQPHRDFTDSNLRILSGLAGTAIELLEARSRNMELARCTEELAHMAGHDSLTGMPNRRMLEKRLDDILAGVRRHDEIAVLYVDLDRFKQVNDTLGHGLGDALLKEVASRLRECVRYDDQVARLGGDEFAVLLCSPHVRRHATELAQRLIAELSVPYLLQGQTVRISASIGITFAPIGRGGQPRLDDLLKDADVALYQAKSAGRQTYRCSQVHAAMP